MSMTFVKPMLAKSYEDGKHEFVWNGNYVMEQKWDGYRFQLVDNCLYSRTGKPLGFEPPFKCNAQLDGELVVDPRLGIEQGHGAVSHWLAHDHSKLVMVLFDILVDDDGERDFVDIEFPLSYRRDRLNRLYERIGSDRVWMSKQIEIDKRAVYDSLMEDGCEGAVFKKIDSPYVPGSRAANWVKRKAWDPVDVVITDCLSKPSEWRVRPGEVDSQTGQILPDGDHSEPWKMGYVGLSYGYYDTKGCVIRVGGLGFTGPAHEMTKFVGRVASVKTYGKVNPTGALNHPVWLEWRDDKDASECIFNFEKGVLVS